MQKKPYISMPVIRRLPRYYRFLRHLDKRGVTRISSKELSEKMGFTASQVRQDFNCFGGYGQQGYGYGVHQLCEEIGSILGVDRAHKCILIGAGNLGKAIATHISYNFAGFDLIGIFDNSEHCRPTRTPRCGHPPLLLGKRALDGDFVRAGQCREIGRGAAL